MEPHEKANRKCQRHFQAVFDECMRRNQGVAGSKGFSLGKKTQFSKPPKVAYWDGKEKSEIPVGPIPSYEGYRMFIMRSSL